MDIQRQSLKILTRVRNKGLCDGEASPVIEKETELEN